MKQIQDIKLLCCKWLQQIQQYTCHLQHFKVIGSGNTLSVLKMGKHCSHLSLLLQILTFIFSLHSEREMVIHITLFLHQWVNKYSSLTAKGVNEQRRLRALLEAHFNKSSFVFGLSCKRVEFELQFRARLINEPSLSSQILGSSDLTS